ncbi:MAG TPA: AMP-binding protein [Caulobacterales bacterium]|nr:AMP-binding protein [Caulobacterales bacterium]
MSRVLCAIAQHAYARPNAVALASGAMRMSYADLAREVDATAFALSGAIRDGAGCVAVGLGNGPAWVVLDLALMQLRRASLPLPTFFTPSQTDAALADAGADWLVSATPSGAPMQIAGEQVFLRRLDGGAGRLQPGAAKVTYTSGSTGAPKGVCLSQAQMEYVAFSIVERFGVHFAGTHAPLLPLGVLLENVAGLYSVLLAGGCYHVEPADELGCANPFKPDFERMGAALTRAGATSLILVPELLRGVMAACAFGKMSLPRLNLAAVGGAKVAPDLIKAARSIGLPVFEGYGLTECASVVAVNAPSGDRLGSVGRPLAHVDLSIQKDGEIVVGGDAFLGYARRSPHFGVTPTGDIGHIDDDGFLFVTGRKSNVIITSFGRNVSPEWVESELLAEPTIRQALVFGEGRAELRALVTPVYPSVERSVVAASIERANARLPAYARIGAFELAAPFTVEAGELTGNGRPRRQAILAAHADFVNG